MNLLEHARQAYNQCHAEHRSDTHIVADKLQPALARISDQSSSKHTTRASRETDKCALSSTKQLGQSALVSLVHLAMAHKCNSLVRLARH